MAKKSFWLGQYEKYAKDSWLNGNWTTRTTGAAALELGWRYIGIERQENFHQLACLRLAGVERERNRPRATSTQEVPY